MAQIDYQAHNFTCYTVPECSSNDELEFQPNTTGKYGSQYSLESTESTTSSIDNNILRKHQNQIKYYKKFFNPYWATAQQQHHQQQQHQQQQQQRLSVPLIMASTGNSPQYGGTYQQYANTTFYQQIVPYQNTQQLQQQNIDATSPQLGYFVPFAPNCYFSPPIQRKKLRYC